MDKNAITDINVIENYIITAIDELKESSAQRPDEFPTIFLKKDKEAVSKNNDAVNEAESRW